MFYEVSVLVRQSSTRYQYGKLLLSRTLTCQHRKRNLLQLKRRKHKTFSLIHSVMFTIRDLDLPCSWCGNTPKAVNAKIPASLCCCIVSLSLSWPNVRFINSYSRLWQPTSEFGHETRLETKLVCTTHQNHLLSKYRIWSTVGDVTFPLWAAPLVETGWRNLNVSCHFIADMPQSKEMEVFAIYH